VIPILGNKKVHEVTRADIAEMMARLSDRPVGANRVLSSLRKMFNLAEVWGYRPDGSNPCRHIPKYPENGKTRLIRDDELRRLFAYLDRADAEGLEHPFLLLAIRLQFEFAARMSEILQLRWEWIDLPNRRVVWPDSKTGGMSKPISQEAARLFETAPTLDSSPFVCPSIFDPSKPMAKHTYYHAWKRILTRAGVPHVGTHGIRHRSATDIANSGVPVKVGMALTAHKTVTMFMRYVHTEDDPVRAAAEAVAGRRREIVTGWENGQSTTVFTSMPSTQPIGAGTKPASEPIEASDDRPLQFDSPGCKPPTLIGNYSPFRHRRRVTRAIPPGTKRAERSTGSEPHEG
jgi:integrase